jgi:protein HOOK3
MYSPSSNERMVDLMQSLGRKVAQPIAIFFGEMEELNESMENDYGETEPSSEVDYSSEGDLPEKSSYKRDPELEREEQLIRALQEKKKLEARLADVVSELEGSRERCTFLEDELAESKYALDRRRGKSVDDQDMAQFNQRADRDKEFIEELEADLATARSTVEQQNRQLEKFKADAQSKQELKDELQLISAERDELRQKAKANENLKKKIQALQEQEKANQSLHQDIQMMQEQIQEADNLRDRCIALEKANEENAQTIANGEQEIFDQKTARRMLDHELKLITQKWEQSKELLINAQETIRDLEERANIGPGSDEIESGFGTLDDELNAEAGAVSGKEVTKKSRQSISAADSVALHQNLSIANASVTRLQHRCLDLLQENLGFKAVIDGVDLQNPRRDLQPFEHQARKLEETTKELESIKTKYITVLNQMNDVKQRIGKSEGGVSLVTKENQERQKFVEEMETELGDTRNLLRHALLGTDALQRQESRIRSSNEFKLVTQQLQRVKSTPANESEQTIKAIAINITDRIESVRVGLAEKSRMLADRSAEYDDLQTQFEALKSRPPPVPPKDDVSIISFDFRANANPGPRTSSPIRR